MKKVLEIAVGAAKKAAGTVRHWWARAFPCACPLYGTRLRRRDISLPR